MNKQENLVSIPAGKVTLVGSLLIPNHATGVVLFVDGSGSSRLSPRNNYVAEILRSRGSCQFLFLIICCD